MTEFALESSWNEFVPWAATTNPIKKAPSWYWRLFADYVNPVLFLDWDDEFKMRTSDYVILEEAPPSEIPEGATSQHRLASNGGESVSFDIRFWWPPDPGAAAGYTAPLLHWDRSVITGLTTEPLILTDFYAQTYAPAHHNFGESFSFRTRFGFSGLSCATSRTRGGGHPADSSAHRILPEATGLYNQPGWNSHGALNHGPLEVLTAESAGDNGAGSRRRCGRTRL